MDEVQGIIQTCRDPILSLPENGHANKLVYTSVPASSRFKCGTDVSTGISPNITMLNATTPGPVTMTLTPELAGAALTFAPNPIVTSTSPSNGSTGPISIFNHFNIRVAQTGGAKTPWGDSIATNVSLIGPTGASIVKQADVNASVTVDIAADNQGAQVQYTGSAANRDVVYVNRDKTGVTYIDTVVGVSLDADISYRAQGQAYEFPGLLIDTHVSRGRDLETGATPPRVCTGPVSESAVVTALQGQRVLSSSAADAGFMFVGTCDAAPYEYLDSPVYATAFGASGRDLTNVATPAYLVLRLYKPT
ncbi:hypothetical protein JTT96_004847 [Salmonella enterica]|nr:hypothetical protein [Salmonella enterica]